jgi:F0F1-type ATP synthase membrane subunit b/b'
VAAEAVVSANLDEATQRDLVERYIAQVGGSR